MAADVFSYLFLFHWTMNYLHHLSIVPKLILQNHMCDEFYTYPSCC
jgi:hypothetical protein